MDRNLRIRMVLEAGNKVSGPLRDIVGGSNKAAEALKATRDRLREINATQNDIAGFRALKAGLRSGGAELDAARAKVSRLAGEIARTEKPTRGMTREFNAAKKVAAQLGAAHDEQRQKLDATRSKLAEAGISTRHLVAAEQALRAEVKHANAEISEQGKRITEISARMRRFHGARGAFNASQNNSAKMAIAGGSAVGAGIAAVSPLRAVAREAIDFESAMADVRKTVDGMDDAAEFNKMSGAILDLSTRLPMAADGIAAIVAAGGQIKVPRAELLQFAEDATKMGIAFDISGDQAGETMAKWRAAFGVGRDGALKLANQVNLVGNNGANTLNVADIVTRIGPLGAVAGAASGEIAAMGATLDAVGVQSEIAATGIKNTMLALTKGASATKDQRAAFKELGLDAEAVSKSMQKNASATIVDVMQRIRGVRKDRQAGLLTDLFGSESVSAIAPMVGQLDKLRGFLALVNDQQQVNGSMEAEYASRSKTTANAIKLAENNLAALKITMGTELLPTITATAQGLGSAIRSFRAFASENPVLAGLLMKVVAAFGALMIAAGSFLFIGAGVKAAFAPFQFAATMMGTTVGASALRLGKALLVPLRVLPALGRGALTLATTVGRAGLMLLTNPMVLALVALTAAVALAGYLIWKHSDKIKAAFASAGAFLSGLASRFTTFGANIIQGLVNGITGRLAQLKNTVVNAASSAATWFKKKLGIHSPSRVFLGFGGFMMEGLSNGIAAGERAPVRRIDSLARRLTGAMALGTIAPAMAAASASPGRMAGSRASAASTASRSIEIHIHQQPGQSATDLARAVADELDRRERETAARGRSSYGDTPDWETA
ncbi:phage tail tape measure protein [uncultured Sphingomonas sp.]|uniref:phage tail tape measure protein n=1 Tax=uncultured Sphingomonas sp. TaxID=158754 RepID=UPI0025F0BBA6|nr:phage tail tape measure protein [uncultured Sphingomonas sp.]